MGDQEEDQCMDLAAAGADNPETTAPMAARSRCRVRPRARGGAGAAIGTGLVPLPELIESGVCGNLVPLGSEIL